MLELGAGPGRGIANGAAAARSLGRPFHVVGVEAEPTHFRWMQEHLRDNRIAENAETIEAAAAPSDGKVPFHVGAPSDGTGSHIGIRSNENEERLRVLSCSLGRHARNDYAGGATHETPYGAIPFEDGVQTWINLRLVQE
jgi:hypothetical protein